MYKICILKCWFNYACLLFISNFKNIYLLCAEHCPIGILTKLLLIMNQRIGALHFKWNWGAAVKLPTS